MADHALDELVLGDRYAEGLPLHGVLDAGLQAGLDQPRRAGGDGVAPVVERGHRDLEALALLAEAVRRRHPHVLEHDRAGIAGAHAELAVNTRRPDAELA